MTVEPNHWNFFKLPPFFTMQPAAAALARQVTLWEDLIMDHAAHHARLTNRGVCSHLRLYSSTSDVFRNNALRRRLPPEDATKILSSLASRRLSHCISVEDANGDYSVLVACNEGGLAAIEQSLLAWILERGAGTTAASLAQNGAVMTFDELVEGQCLVYKRENEPMICRLAQDDVPVGDVGALTEEQAVRTLLKALATRPASIRWPYRITFFNLDGSSVEPYQGVKFGGVVC
ncbi:putative ESCRT II complex subunit [Trypanosoma vivax]|uniref:Uncharacterized protein n=1 Tax=Trypanosoma vivax (strain Y486) TaxID=1055687 RepID=G0U6B8_TRYVY|nr:hypothetical protein TRVL_01354 [Trypanosoma vivax]KAH8611294.1 putative ESCRT II complex subunit [Trypanosoma vivax]CCC51422.1 conserved hypothetical protein [Trypanosoma vivax Y486]